MYIRLIAAFWRSEKKDKGKSVIRMSVRYPLSLTLSYIVFQLPDRTWNVLQTMFLRCSAWTWYLGPELRSPKNWSTAVAVTPCGKSNVIFLKYIYTLSNVTFPRRTSCHSVVCETSDTANRQNIMSVLDDAFPFRPWLFCISTRIVIIRNKLVA